GGNLIVILLLKIQFLNLELLIIQNGFLKSNFLLRRAKHAVHGGRTKVLYNPNLGIEAAIDVTNGCGLVLFQCRKRLGIGFFLSCVSERNRKSGVVLSMVVRNIALELLNLRNVLCSFFCKS